MECNANKWYNASVKKNKKEASARGFFFYIGQSQPSLLTMLTRVGLFIDLLDKMHGGSVCSLWAL
jgi:hypothetical protein